MNFSRRTGLARTTPGAGTTVVLRAALLAVLLVPVAASALEVDLPLIVPPAAAARPTASADALSTSTNPEAPVGWLSLTLERRAADGWFDQSGVLQGENFSVVETRAEFSVGVLLGRRWNVALAVPLLARTLDFTGSGNAAGPSSDITARGFGDARLGLGFHAWWSVTAAVDLYAEWKPPTGADDLVQPGGELAASMGTLPLGTGSHEFDLGILLRYSPQRAPWLQLDGWTGARLRVGFPPLWMFATGPILWGAAGPERPHQLVLGGRATVQPLARWPGLTWAVTWHHPLTATRTNLVETRVGLFADHPGGRMSVDLEAPVYGKFYPDPFPFFFLDRSPSLGIAVRGTVSQWF